MGKGNYAKERECAICKNKFIARNQNTKYCGVKCKKEAELQMNIAYKIKRKEKEAEKKKRSTAVIDIASEAKKAGMSYGRYVALHNL